MKKLATKLTPAIKAWIKEEFGSDRYQDYESGMFHWYELKGIKYNNNLYRDVQPEYTEVSEQEFLAEFGKPTPIIQHCENGIWRDLIFQKLYRIKPTIDYSPEIEALQNKAKENNQKVTIIFE